MTPEFARPERVETIGTDPRTITITASADERRRLAARFALLSVDRLDARFAVRRDPAGIVAEGRVEAEVVQPCAVTGDPVPARVDETLTLRFVEPAPSEEEIELSDETLDTIEIEDGAIDLGEAAAETMALALDPFPRGAGAAAALAAAGVVDETAVGAFSGLAALRDRLKG